jgi:hypothetical protein
MKEIACVHSAVLKKVNIIHESSHESLSYQHKTLRCKREKEESDKK